MSNLIGCARSWITTAIGIVSGLAVILPQLLYVVDGDPTTEMSIQKVIMGLGLMGIGFFAKDGNKSSEDIGIK